MLFAIGGCTSLPQQYKALETPAGKSHQVELEDTPFHPQSAYQCGPAALATVLQASGVDNANPERLAGQVYVPRLRGSLQTELLGATRRADRVPYPLAPRLADLLDEVRAGHPVLVLQNLGLSVWPQWHYAVVIGFDMDAGQIILRSGSTARQVMSFRRFERTWRLGEYWALVVPKPGELPATASALRYLEAVSALEQQQRWDAASTAYHAARDRWPDNVTSYLGLGNIAYQRGEYEIAADQFRAAARLAPEQPAAHYNLAWAYLRQGSMPEALKSARRAEALAPGHPRYARAGSEIATEAQKNQNQNGEAGKTKE